MKLTKEQKLYLSNEIVYDNKLGYVTRERATKKQISRDVNKLSATLLFFFVAQIAFVILLSLISIIAMIFGKQINLIGVEFEYAMSACLSFLGLAFPFVIYKRVIKEKISSGLEFNKPIKYSWLFVVAGTGIGFLMNVPANLISNVFIEVGIDLGTVTIANPTTVLGLVLMFFAISVVAALVEEFVLRGIVLAKLRKYGDVFAIVVSSLLFSILHINLVSIFVTFCAGLIIGYVYVKTRNLWMSVLIHFLNNFISCILTLVSENLGNEGIGALVQNLLFYLPMLFGIIALVFLIAKKQLKLENSNNYKFLSAGKKFSSAILNPTTIVLISICVLLGLSMVVVL